MPDKRCPLVVAFGCPLPVVRRRSRGRARVLDQLRAPPSPEHGPPSGPSTGIHGGTSAAAAPRQPYSLLRPTGRRQLSGGAAVGAPLSRYFLVAACPSPLARESFGIAVQGRRLEARRARGRLSDRSFGSKARGIGPLLAADAGAPCAPSLRGAAQSSRAQDARARPSVRRGQTIACIRATKCVVYVSLPLRRGPWPPSLCNLYNTGRVRAVRQG